MTHAEILALVDRLWSQRNRPRPEMVDLDLPIVTIVFDNSTSMDYTLTQLQRISIDRGVMIDAQSARGR